MKNCIFCEIALGNARAKVVLETDDFIAFENIDPKAPVHVLAIPKRHIEKRDAINGKESDFWDNMFEFVIMTIQKLGLDKTGYRLVNNGAGYQGVDHEHIHILGGEGWKPKDGL